ncbi:MAG: hypothetical protein GX666_12755 [Tissierellia bacterium]|nr:hypothetical protein [Tissierellia bacterium]
MIIDSIQEIRKLEEDLELKVQEAKNAASESIRRAQSEGEIQAQEIIDRANETAKEIIENRTKEAEQVSDELLKKGELEFERMKNLTDEELGRAVELVLERIVI